MLSVVWVIPDLFIEIMIILWLLIFISRRDDSKIEIAFAFVALATHEVR